MLSQNVKRKKNTSSNINKVRKKPFGNDLKGITEISLRIMNLYWQVKVFEPIDIYIWDGKYDPIVLGNSIGFADPSAVTTGT